MKETKEKKEIENSKINEEQEGLKKLKKDYEVLAKKYTLPSFDKLNEEFVIEKVSEFETDLLLKLIRNFMSEKIATYMRVVENLLNPVNAPMFVFSMVKSLDKSDKEKLFEIYKKFSKIEIELIELDLEYSEKKEANFIKEAFKLWDEVRKDLLFLVGKMKENIDVKSEANEKNYFG
jgi:hypothetical protein